MNSTMGFPSYSYNNNNNDNFIDNNIQDKLNSFVFNPVILIVIVAIIILYYAIFASLGEKNDENNTNTAFLEILMWGVFISLLLLNGMQYFFNINIIASIKNIFTHDPEINIKVDTSQYDNNNYNNNNDSVIPEIKLKKQVFHIPGNNYTYNNANAICSAYGAK